MLTVGSRIVATAIDLDYLGQGIVRHEGMVVFVPYLLTGETAEIRIEKIKDSFAEGIVLNLIERSKDRKDHHDSVYGAADLLHLSDEAQLLWQEKITGETLKKIGGIDMKIDPAVTDGKTIHYRNKSVFHVMDSPRLSLGLYDAHQHRLIQAESLILSDLPTNKILAFLTENPVFVDQNTFTHLVIRTNPKGDALVTLVSKQPSFRGMNALVDRLKELAFVIGVTLNLSENNPSILGKHSIVLYGENLITEPIGSLEVDISDRSFFQVNLPVSLLAYEIIRSEIIKDAVILDAYSGIGSIGFYLAEHARKIVMIESNPASVQRAKDIKIRYGFDHIDILEGRSEALFQHVSADVLIVDPPRNGLMPAMKDAILQKTPRQMFYLSCDVKTLARDLKSLKDKFAIDKVIPIRMFPQTTELETLVIMKRRD